MVDASNGETLAEADRYTKAIAEVPSGSLANVYVDIGSLIQQAGPIDPQAQLFLRSAGIDPSEATATASAIPAGSDPGRDHCQHRHRRHRPQNRLGPRSTPTCFHFSARPTPVAAFLPSPNSAGELQGRRSTASTPAASRARFPRTQFREHAEEGGDRPRPDRRLGRRPRRLRRRQRNEQPHRRRRADHATKLRPQTRSPTSASCCAPPTLPE